MFSNRQLEQCWMQSGSLSRKQMRRKLMVWKKHLKIWHYDNLLCFPWSPLLLSSHAVSATPDLAPQNLVHKLIKPGTMILFGKTLFPDDDLSIQNLQTQSGNKYQQIITAEPKSQDTDSNWQSLRKYPRVVLNLLNKNNFLKWTVCLSFMD